MSKPIDASGVDSEAAVDIRGLTKAYGRKPLPVELSRYFAYLKGRTQPRVTALDGVDLSVQHGEVFGLLGPNGAGKTTLIKILSTLVFPDSGRVSVYGVDVVKKPRLALKRLQTVLAQNEGFELRLSGRRNLEFFAALYGIPREEARRKIDSLLEFSGLIDRGDAPFQSYSTGLARRLLVCRALLSNASLLIFDEPTSSLDPVSASEFRKFIRKDLIESGRTIFVATHNLFEAEQICSRIAVIQRGRIIAQGTPDEIRGMVGDRVSLHLVLAPAAPPERASLERLKTTLESVNGVIEVGVEWSERDPALTILAHRNNIDYNAVLQTILDTKARINSIESNEPSLEQAFISLVNGGGKS